MITELENRFKSLISNYTNDKDLITSFWKEIELHYNKKNRYYHNLHHISAMLDLADKFKSKIIDFETLLFAIWYHDIIYKATKNNNEVKSAEFAEKRLKRLKIDSKRIEICIKLIISTKKHEILLLNNDDNKWLLDFDLAILSSIWEIYSEYAKKIRKEYHIYPDFVYFKGRKEVLKHFLKRNQLYFTEYFYEKHENDARENLRKELKTYD